MSQLPEQAIADSAPAHVSGLVDHLFRHQSGQVVATLTRIFGFAYIDLIEDVVQESLIKALKQWPYRGVPDNPGAWIMRVAKNGMLDELRREKIMRAKQEVLAEHVSDVDEVHIALVDTDLLDDQLRMMFACCHPALSREAQVTLILKVLCGFSVSEIACAFLTQDSTIAQRLVRAKRTIHKLAIPLVVPDAREFPARLAAILDALYLLFNEGYSAHAGDAIVRHDLSDEAIRLTRLLLKLPAGDVPSVHALLALMLFNAARFPARTNADGNIVLLEDQDRTLWDRSLIGLGLRELVRSAQGDSMSIYHYQAGIASCHAVAPTYEATDWPRILEQYDMLLAISASPVVALNHAVALAMVRGPEVGLAALDRVRTLPGMENYYLLHATYGSLWRRVNNVPNAIKSYQKALSLTAVEPERRFLLRKLAEL